MGNEPTEFPEAPIIGISITVFMVDKIIKGRESQKLLPMKHVAYAQLFVAIDNGLNSIAPIGLWDFSDYHFIFGKFEVHSLYKIDKIKSSSMMERLKKQDELTMTINKDEFKLDILKRIDSVHLIRSKLDDISVKYYSVIDNDINNLLHVVQFKTDEYIRHMSDNINHDLDIEDFPFLHAVFLSDVTDTLVDIRMSLEQVADEVITTSERIKRLNIKRIEIACN